MIGARLFLAAILLVLSPPAFAKEAEKWVKLDVPYVPTPPVVIEAMLKLAAVKPDDVLYDLGSGDGRIVIAAIRDFGVKRGVGIDLNPKRVAEANENAKTASVTDRATFIEGDVFKEDFSAATVVTMYLFDNVNLRLRPRILDELKPGTRIVSHQFHMFDWVPDSRVMVLEKIPVYFWIVPAKVQGSWQGTMDGQTASLNLKQHMQEVSGEISIGGVKAAVATSKVVGDRLVVDAVAPRGPTGSMKITFAGKVAGDAIAGALIVDGARHDVTLRRAAAP